MNQSLKIDKSHDVFVYKLASELNRCIWSTKFLNFTVTDEVKFTHHCQLSQSRFWRKQANNLPPTPIMLKRIRLFLYWICTWRTKNMFYKELTVQLLTGLLGISWSDNNSETSLSWVVPSTVVDVELSWDWVELRLSWSWNWVETKMFELSWVEAIIPLNLNWIELKLVFLYPC